MSITQAIANAARTLGTLVEAYAMSTPLATPDGAVSFATRNVDLLINHLVTNPVLQKFADELANEVIKSEVPGFLAKEMQKLGGIPVAADPTAAQAGV